MPQAEVDRPKKIGPPTRLSREINDLVSRCTTGSIEFVENVIAALRELPEILRLLCSCGDVLLAWAPTLATSIFGGSADLLRSASAALRRWFDLPSCFTQYIYGFYEFGSFHRLSYPLFRSNRIPNICFWRNGHCNVNPMRNSVEY